MVQQDQVRFQFLGFSNCFQSVPCFCNDTQFGACLQHGTDSSSPRLKIVYDQNTD
jgi:hypothetical protein